MLRAWIKGDRLYIVALVVALIGTPIADAKRPLEIIRTVHSFDPCIACAVHVMDPEGEELMQVKVT